MKISIFGGSQLSPNDQMYKTAYELGNSLAAAGHIIQTGGYIGVMEAVSRGANEAGGQAIGITCSEIENWRDVKANLWVTQELRFNTLVERMNYLISSCDAIVVLPGGPGTLAEFSVAWNLMIIQAIPRKPLILLGNRWRLLIQLFIRSFSSFVPKAQRGYLFFVTDIDSISEHLNHIQP
jgi:uncharacterized protein (TIGR00725 family)